MRQNFGKQSLLQYSQEVDVFKLHVKYHLLWSGNTHHYTKKVHDKGPIDQHELTQKELNLYLMLSANTPRVCLYLKQISQPPNLSELSKIPETNGKYPKTPKEGGPNLRCYKVLSSAALTLCPHAIMTS